MTTLVAAFGNLFGPDVIMIALLLVFFVGPVVGVIIGIVYLCRRKSAQRPPPLPASERLRELDLMKEQNLISAAEHEEQRRRIISGV